MPNMNVVRYTISSHKIIIRNNIDMNNSKSTNVSEEGAATKKTTTKDYDKCVVETLLTPTRSSNKPGSEMLLQKNPYDITRNKRAEFIPEDKKRKSDDTATKNDIMIASQTDTTNVVNKKTPNNDDAYVDTPVTSTTHPVYYDLNQFKSNGFVILKVDRVLQYPRFNPINFKFRSIFNTDTTTNGMMGLDEKAGRCHTEISEESEHRFFINKLVQWLSSQLPEKLTFRTVLLSVLGRKLHCKQQLWHRDGNTGFFILVPITSGYTIGVVPTSHVDYSEPMINNATQVEYKNIEDSKVVKLTIHKGEVLVCFRKVIHCGGPSSSVVLTKSKKSSFTDLAYHAHLSLDHNVENPFENQSTNFVQFFREINPLI